jgi:hypothetical protein
VREYVPTHRKNKVLSLFATLVVCPGRELDGSFHNGLCQLICRAALKGSPAEQEFKDANAKAPVVHVPSVSFACIMGIEERFDRTTGSKQGRPNDERQRTSEYFWRHVRHTSSHAGVQSALRVMDRDVEIGEMDVPFGIQKNIVRLEITAALE